MKDQQKAITILSNVCDFMHQSVGDVIGDCRKREYVEARHFSMYFIKKHTRFSTSRIGEIMGGRDHASVIHGCRMAENLIGFNGYKSLSEKLNRLILQQINMAAPMCRERRIRYHYRAMFRRARRVV